MNTIWLWNATWLPVPLWADLDVESIIKIAFFIIFIFGSAFAKLASSIFSKANRNQMPAPPQARAAEAPDPVRQEVSDFLKKLGVELPSNQAEETEEVELVEAQEVQRGPDTISSWRASLPKGNSPRESYDDPFPSGQRVEQHVREHLDTTAIRQHATSLGENVGRTDERLESRLREKFQHAIGNIPGSTVRTTAPVAEGTDSAVWNDTRPTTNINAQRIRQLLHSPQSFRDALIISEIMRPPTDT